MILLLILMMLIDNIDADADADVDNESDADPWLCLQGISTRHWVMTILQIKCE